MNMAAESLTVEVLSSLKDWERPRQIRGSDAIVMLFVSRQQNVMVASPVCPSVCLLPARLSVPRPLRWLGEDDSVCVSCIFFSSVYS